MPDPSLLYRKLFLAKQAQFLNQYGNLFGKVANDVSQLVNNPSAKFAKAFQFNKTIDTGLSQIITTFNKDSLKLQVSNIEGSWGLANLKNDKLVNEYLSLLGNLKGITSNPLFSASVNFSPNTSALQAFITRKYNSENVSDKIWKIGDQLRNEMEVHLGLGIANGDSAETISRRIRQYLQKPDDLFRRVMNSSGNLMPSNSMLTNAPGKGVYNSAYKNAMRLARTETNMAFQLADHERWMTMQMVTGQRIELSGSHPDYNFPEICEELEGDYPKEFIFAGWHPQCLCHVVPIMMPKENFRKFLRGETVKINPVKVKDIPFKFKNWVVAYGEKMERAKTQPYWYSLNKDFIQKMFDQKVAATAIKQAEVQAVAQALAPEIPAVVPIAAGIAETNSFKIILGDDLATFNKYVSYYDEYFADHADKKLLKLEAEAYTKKYYLYPDEVKRVTEGDAGVDVIKRIKPWQWSANSWEAISFKLTGESIETTNKTIIKDLSDLDKGFIKDNPITKDEYLRLRAISQSYMKTIEFPDEIELMRGIDGGTGAQMVKDLMNGDPGIQYQKITDNSLSGYTTSWDTANRFGHDDGGITVRFTMKKEDIILHKDLLSGITHSFNDEQEFIVRGIDRGINIKDIRFRWKNNKGFYLTKDFDETLEQFQTRVKNSEM